MVRRTATRREVLENSSQAEGLGNAAVGLNNMTTKEYFLQVAEFYAAGLEARWSETQSGGEGEYAGSLRKVQDEIIAARKKKLASFKEAVHNFPSEPQN